MREGKDVHDQMHSAARAGAGKDPLHIGLEGRFRDAERNGDLPVRRAAEHEFDDSRLLTRKHQVTNDRLPMLDRDRQGGE